MPTRAAPSGNQKNPSIASSEGSTADQQQQQARPQHEAAASDHHTPTTRPEIGRYPPSHHHHRPSLESDSSSPLTSNSFGGSPGQNSQEPTPPGADTEHPHHAYQHPHHSHPTTYLQHPRYGTAMPMYSGGSGGGAAAAYPPPPQQGGTYHRGAPHAPPIAHAPHHGYIMHHPSAPVGYVVAAPQGSAAPHGYMAYATSVPPGYAQPSGSEQQQSRSATGRSSPPESIRSSPSLQSHTASQYRTERAPSGSGGSSFASEHPMYPPSSSPTMPHSRILRRSGSGGGGGNSPHPQGHERSSPHAPPPPPQGYHHSPHAPPHHPLHARGPHEAPRRQLRDEKESSSSSLPDSSNTIDDRTAEEIQAQRERQAAEYELSLSRVKPITTDFHWFSREESAHEVAPAEIESDLYLRNSYVNARLKHRWESMQIEDRMEYLKKEEADRRRFTEEEEVASRHCATLTARAPSTPSIPVNSHSRKEKRSSLSGASGGGSNTNRADGDDEGESPTKKNKLESPEVADVPPAVTAESSGSSEAPTGV